MIFKANCSALVVMLGSILCCCGLRAATPLEQEVYVWQRAWNDPVVEAVTNHGPAFARLVVLAGEVDWRDHKPVLVPVQLDYPALVAARRPVGIALRIAAYSGPFAANDPAAAFLSSLAARLINEAREKGIVPSEFQIDFDCAAAKLDGYRMWVDAIRRKISPTPLTITALPSWLKQSAFKPLVEATDGYVLQVHSLEKPRDINAPFTLCDPSAAISAAQLAGQFGVPFRVALPTYGYLFAFDRNGRFIGLSAEGPNKSWPDDVQVREVRADPLEMSRLTQFWSTNCPSSMRGIIWYRLPVSVDNFNWHWPTLGAIVASRLPRESWRGESRRIETGLVEINLVNDGELDLSSRLVVEVRWSRQGGTRLVAADGLHGFTMLDAGTSVIKFQNQSQPGRLAAGEKQTVGWLRFDRDCEVQIEVRKL